MSQTPAHEPPSAPRTRIALIGCGFIGAYHLSVLGELEGVEVVALVDPDLERAEALAGTLPGVRALSSVEGLGELDVEVAHVLTPPQTHEALIRSLLEAGCSVYVEKPAVSDARTARELARLAQERGLSFATNHNHAYHPAFLRLMSRVKAGEIGRVEHVQVTWSVALGQIDGREFSHWMFRSPRNVVFEQGLHPLSQVHALIGAVSEVTTTVLGTRELAPGQEFHDRWLVAGVGERGTCELYMGFSRGFARNTLQVIGTDGVLEADFAQDTLLSETSTHWIDAFDQFVKGWRKRKSHGAEAVRSLSGYLGSTLKLKPRDDGWYAGMRNSIHAFYSALAAKQTPPTDGEQAAQVLEWCERVAAHVSDEAAPEVQVREVGEARPGEVVVFGATGFIGRPTVRKLLEAGRPVTVVLRDPRRLPPDLGKLAESGELRVICGSLGDGKAVGEAVFGAERVLHLAPGGGATWKEVQASTVHGTELIAHACARNDIKRLVYVSSVAALYTGDDVEGLLADSTATDRLPEHRAPYSRGKIACEQALLKLHKEQGLSVIIMRPGVVVGENCPLQHSGFGYWPRENHCIGWGLGDHPIPLVLVEDVADALVAATLLESSELDGQALNLCSRLQVTARDMVEGLRDASGRALQFHGRPLESSFAMEVGKWVVKGVGRRAQNDFPSWRDLKARALYPEFASNLAREVLAWKPVEEREAFLERAVAVHAPEMASNS